jgi:hypothetical protein
LAASTLLGACGGGGDDAGVVAPATITAGASCNTIGARSDVSGTRFDCVSVGGALQWQPRGSRPNPFAWGEKAVVTTAFAVWEVTLTTVTPDVTARVLAVDNRNQPPAAGAQLVGLNLELRYVGSRAEESVRQGANLSGTTGAGSRIDRWVGGAGTDDDCWVNETVTRESTKVCMTPFEVATDRLAALDFFASDAAGEPLVYFRGLAR